MNEQRAEAIKAGRIRPHDPRGIIPFQSGVALNADQLDQRGYHDAARAIRNYHAAIADWAWRPHGPRPRR